MWPITLLRVLNMCAPYSCMCDQVHALIRCAPRADVHQMCSSGGWCCRIRLEPWPHTPSNTSMMSEATDDSHKARGRLEVHE